MTSLLDCPRSSLFISIGTQHSVLAALDDVPSWSQQIIANRRALPPSLLPIQVNWLTSARNIKQGASVSYLETWDRARINTERWRSRRPVYIYEANCNSFKRAPHIDLETNVCRSRLFRLLNSWTISKLDLFIYTEERLQKSDAKEIPNWSRRWRRRRTGCYRLKGDECAVIVGRSSKSSESVK